MGPSVATAIAWIESPKCDLGSFHLELHRGAVSLTFAHETSLFSEHKEKISHLLFCAQILCQANFQFSCVCYCFKLVSDVVNNNNLANSQTIESSKLKAIILSKLFFGFLIGFIRSHTYHFWLDAFFVLILVRGWASGNRIDWIFVALCPSLTVERKSVQYRNHSMSVFGLRRTTTTKAITLVGTWKRVFWRRLRNRILKLITFNSFLFLSAVVCHSHVSSSQLAHSLRHFRSA